MSQVSTAASVPIIRCHVALRGLAAGTVLLAHLNGYGLARVFNQNIYERCFYWYGYAVDLFFMLSGFVMFWVYVAGRDKVAWASFHGARAARILPLYYLTLIVSISMAVHGMLRHGLSTVGQGYPAKLLANATLCSGVVGGWQWTINQPAWSISVEMFCYLIIFPLLVAAQRKYKYSVLLPIIAGIASVCIVVGSYEHLERFNISGWDSSWVARGTFDFTCGFAVCWLFQCVRQSKWPEMFVTAPLLILIAIFVLSRMSVFPEQRVIYLFPLTLFFTAFDTGIVADVLKLSFFQWLGERSYSIYLWQFPGCIAFLFLGNHMAPSHPTYMLNDVVYATLEFVLALGFIVAVAELSYSFFETPLRIWLRKVTHVRKAGPEEWREHPFSHK